MQAMGDQEGRSAPLKNLLSNTDAVEGRRFLKMLMRASGEIEAAALLGGKYTPASLNALTGGMKEFLSSLCFDLAIGPCYRRRPGFAGPEIEQENRARAFLVALEQGAAIFGLQENIDASHMELTIDTPRDVDIRDLTTVIARPMMGRRGNQYPLR